jgi:hypothetical protein
MASSSAAVCFRHRLNTRQAQRLKFAQQPAIGHKEFTQDLGNAKDPLSMGYRLENLLTQPAPELHHALLMARGAEMTILA